MVSLETAQKLKDLGLKWEPQIGDFFAHVDGKRQEEVWHPNIFVVSGEHVLVEELGGRMVFFGGGLCVRGAGCRMDETHCYCMNRTGLNPDIKTFSVASWEKELWLPRFDQLLSEIEGQGYIFQLTPSVFDSTTREIRGYYCDIISMKQAGTEHGDWEVILHNSKEEAAAQAYIWIRTGGTA